MSYYQSGEVSAVLDTKIKVSLPSGREVHYPLSHAEKVKISVSDKVVAVLSDNMIDRTVGNEHAHAVLKIITKHNPAYEGAAKAAERTSRKIDVAIDDLSLLPGYLNEIKAEGLNQAFFTFKGMRRPSYKRFNLKKAIYNGVRESRLDFSFRGEKGGLKQFDVLGLQRALEEKPEDFANIEELKLLLPKLGGEAYNKIDSFSSDSELEHLEKKEPEKKLREGSRSSETEKKRA